VNKHKNSALLSLEKFPTEGNPPSPDGDATRTELLAAPSFAPLSVQKHYKEHGKQWSLV